MADQPKRGMRTSGLPRNDDPTELAPRPAPPPPPNGSDTTARLRRDIDSGRTGDKVAAIDPAAAPLGTDDEAGGHAPGRETIAATRRQERAGPHAEASARITFPMRWWLVLLTMAVAVAGVAWMFGP